MRIPIGMLPPLPAELPLLPGGIPDTGTDAATAANAQFLWRAAHAIAEDKGTPAVYQTVPGRKWQVDMSAVLKRAFGGISRNQESMDARNDLYKWLRDTRNMVCLQRLGYAGGIWWVADEWNGLKPGAPSVSESALTTYSERRLRPEEAGEYRDPMPVVAGYRCTVPGCPDTQMFPHPGALAEHRALSHQDEPVSPVEPEIAVEAYPVSPDGPVSPDVPAEPDYSQEAVAQRVFDAIQESGLTQRQIGEALGLHNSSISSMITGRQRISVEQIFGIAQITGTTVASLLGLPPVVQMLAPVTKEAPVVALPPSAPLVVSEIPTRELLSVIASRVEAAEAEARALRAAASDSDRDELVAELREENKMHLRTIAEMRGDVHRARKLMGRE